MFKSLQFIFHGSRGQISVCGSQTGQQQISINIPHISNRSYTLDHKHTTLQAVMALSSCLAVVGNSPQGPQSYSKLGCRCQISQQFIHSYSGMPFCLGKHSIPKRQVHYFCIEYYPRFNGGHTMTLFLVISFLNKLLRWVCEVKK